MSVLSAKDDGKDVTVCLGSITLQHLELLGALLLGLCPANGHPVPSRSCSGGGRRC